MILEMAGAALLGTYVVLLCAAAVQDVVTLRISNFISIGVAAIGVAGLLAVERSGWWEHGLSFALVFAAGVFLFSRQWMGGGDVKLFSAAALAFDLEGLLRLVPAVLLFGGVIGLAFVGARMVSGGAAGSARRRSLPYGVAIAAGGITAALLFPSHSAFAPEPRAVFNPTAVPIPGLNPDR